MTECRAPTGIEHGETLSQIRSRSAPLVVNEEFVVALRTHVWSPVIADLAARLEAMAAGARFVVLADISNGTLPIDGFKTIFHTDDFTGFGLPSFPPKQVLWYNADYPLYLLAHRFPTASHFAMVEYDVGVNVPLLPMLSKARSDGIDLIAHYIHPADPDWEWTPFINSHFERPFQAFLPFMVISRRAIQHLLGRRQTSSQSNLREFADWPFCEAFIPSSLYEMDSFRTEELSAYADLRHYTLNSVLHPDHPWARKAGSIVHKLGVTSNLALGKPATQSSVHPWWHAESREIDAARGNNGRRGRAEGFNTAAEQNSWWQVDLLAEYDVSKIVIHDRSDAPSTGISLAIATSVDAEIWVFQANVSLLSRTVVSFVHPLRTRYIRVIRRSFGELHLDEIEVF